MDDPLREWALRIYELQGQLKRATINSFNHIKNKGLSLEKQLFEDFKIYERRNLKIEAIQFMEK
jgi:hypothetical protein